MKTKFYWVALLASAAMIAQAKAGGHYGGGGGEALPWPRIQLRHTLPLQHSSPLHAVILVADATSRPERASHRTMRRRHFVNSAWLVLIARLVASLQLERPLVASIDLEQLLVEKPVSHETEMIPGIVSKTAVQTSGASMSLRDAQPIGIVIGTGAVIIGGMDIVATSSTASGSSTTRDSIRTIIGIRTAMATATTDPLTIRMTTIPAFMKATSDYYGQGAYDSSEQYADSTVATAQEQLARQGYYRGEIDGIFGPETRRAVTRYQSDHGLRVTGKS